MIPVIASNYPLFCTLDNSHLPKLVVSNILINDIVFPTNGNWYCKNCKRKLDVPFPDEKIRDGRFEAYDKEFYDNVINDILRKGKIRK